ncbi:hypothetical protein NC652_022435 [Populus alba x Populus x berolinensis]|nr:hypothetical protein NC652_022435 [Populus alba x Populus x berolinensis]
MALSYKFYSRSNSLLGLCSSWSRKHLLDVILGRSVFMEMQHLSVDVKSRKVMDVSRGDLRGEPTSNSAAWNREEWEMRELRWFLLAQIHCIINVGSPPKPRTP